MVAYVFFCFASIDNECAYLELHYSSLLFAYEAVLFEIITVSFALISLSLVAGNRCFRYFCISIGM